MLEIIESYKEYLLDNEKSENTVYAYVTDVNLFIKFLKARDMELYTTDNIAITEYIQSLLDGGKSERSINRIVISLRSFYGFLKIKGKISDIPKITYKSSRTSKKLPQILTIEEVDRIIKSVDKNGVKGIRDNALLELMYATGMKVSELISLDVDDINLDLSFVKCTDNKHYERLIPIGRSATRALEEYILVRDEWRIVKEYSHKAGIKKDVNLNTFRHSFAVHMLQNGANVRAVQKLLGNQVLTYMDTYYEIINSDKINLVYKNAHPRA